MRHSQFLGSVRAARESRPRVSFLSSTSTVSSQLPSQSTGTDALVSHYFIRARDRFQYVVKFVTKYHIRL